MKGLVTIYTLSHPLTKQVFYIGQTTLTLYARLVCHATSKTGGFHLINYIQEMIKQTGKRPIIEEIEKCNKEDRKRVEEYWIQQFSSWGFDLKNRKHCVNKSFYRECEVPKFYEKLTKEENDLINLLYTHGDNQAICRIIGKSNERVRQMLKHRKFSIYYKDKIVDYFISKARSIVSTLENIDNKERKAA